VSGDLTSEVGELSLCGPSRTDTDVISRNGEGVLMKGLDTVRARYAGKASQEWERLTTTPITRTEFLITSHQLQRYLPPSGMILDVGSGPGRYAIDLARRGYRVVMFDLLREMLQLGCRKAAQAGVGHRSVMPTEGDLAALPYETPVSERVLSPKWCGL